MKSFLGLCTMWWIIKRADDTGCDYIVSLCLCCLAAQQPLRPGRVATKRQTQTLVPRAVTRSFLLSFFFIQSFWCLLYVGSTSINAASITSQECSCAWFFFFSFYFFKKEKERTRIQVHFGFMLCPLVPKSHQNVPYCFILGSRYGGSPQLRAATACKYICGPPIRWIGP